MAPMLISPEPVSRVDTRRLIHAVKELLRMSILRGLVGAGGATGGVMRVVIGLGILVTSVVLLVLLADRFSVRVKVRRGALSSSYLVMALIGALTLTTMAWVSLGCTLRVLCMKLLEPNSRVIVNVTIISSYRRLVGTWWFRNLRTVGRQELV